MTTQELIEHACLDALSLLDEDERRAFERAFNAATPAVQAQVRREQTRLSQIEALLPDVDAPASLRQRVLSAVREAIAAAACSAGGGGGGRRHESGRAVPAIVTGRKVSPIWRAGALGFAAAAVVLAVATLDMQSKFTDLALMLQDSDLVDDGIKSVGSDFVETVLFNENVVFEPESDNYLGKASLFIDSSTETATLICQMLPVSDSKYRLVVIDEEGNVGRELASFRSEGRLMQRRLDFDLAPGTRVAILSPADVPGGSTLVLTGTVRLG